jgi:hypothetical protein
MFDPKIDLDGIRRFQMEIRAVIRRSALSSVEREVCTAIVNLWWGKNKTGQTARGLGLSIAPIHPGTSKIARHAKVNVRSAYRAMKVLKALSVIEVLEHQNGGRNAARLKVCFHHILAIENMTKKEIHSPFLSDLKGGLLSDLTSDILSDGNKINNRITENRCQGGNVIPFRRRPKTERPL